MNQMTRRAPVRRAPPGSLPLAAAALLAGAGACVGAIDRSGGRESSDPGTGAPTAPTGATPPGAGTTPGGGEPVTPPSADRCAPAPSGSGR